MSSLKSDKLEVNKSVLIENYCNQIDQKINALKLEYLIEWEKNHNFDSTAIDIKLEQLEDEKNRLCEVLKNISEDIIALDLNELVKAS